jgi:protein MBA1
MKRPLLLRERGRVARELHAKFYAALAGGEMSQIAPLVCKGLENSARLQIEQRKTARKPLQKFRIQSYSGWNAPSWFIWPLTLLPFQSTRVMTDKIAPIPVGKDAWIRQCVVRIKSTQTLDRGSGSGPETKTMEEYVVIQKLAFDGEEQPWKMWGTVQPDSAQDIMRIASGGKFSPVRTFFDIMKEKISGFAGMG